MDTTLGHELERHVEERTATLVQANALLKEQLQRLNRTEQALRESEERFRLVTEATSDAIYDWNLKTGTIWRSEGYLRLLHPPTAQGQRQGWWEERLHPADREKTRASLQAAIAWRKRTWTCEYRFCRDDGAEVFLTDRACIIYDETGAPTRIVGAMSDVTSHKRAEERLQSYTERLGVLRQIDRAILAAQSPEEIARAALSHLRKLISCQHASVTEFTVETQTSVLLAVDSEGETQARIGDQLPFAQDMGLSGHLNKNMLHPGQVWQVEDLHLMSEPSPLLLMLRNEGLHSSISVPLFVQGQHLGLLNIGRSIPGIFSLEHTEIAQEVASSLAVAIHQARLREQVAQHAAGLEQLVAQRTRELEERQRFSEQVVETSPEITYVYDLLNHRIVYLNRQVSTLLGYSAAKAATGSAQTLRTFFHPDDFPHVRDRFRQLATAQDDDILEIEYRMRHRNGEWRWLLDRGRVFARTADGVASLSLGMIQDITERKRTEEALRAAEEEYRAIFEHAGVGIYRSSLDGHQLRANPALVRLNGYASEEEMLPAVNDIATEWYVDPQRRTEFARVLGEQGYVTNFESEVYRHKTRERIWISETARLVRDHAGIPLYYEGTVQDITAQKRAQEALQESEELYRSVVTVLHEGVVIHGADGTIQAWNTSAERILGLSADQLIGRTPFDPRWQTVCEDGSAFPGDHQPAIVTLRTGQPCFNVVMGVRKPDGMLTWIAVNSRPLFRIHTATTYGVVVSFADITASKQAEEALRESERRYRGLVESQQDLVVRVDPEGRFTFVNDAGCKKFAKRRPELLGTSFMPLVHEEDLEATLAAMKNLAFPPHRALIVQRVLTCEGWRWLEWEHYAVHDALGNMTEIQGVGRDITEKVRLQEQLIEHERLAALGRVTGAIAHELGTPLNSVLGYTQLLAQERLPEKARRRLGVIEAQVQRMADIIQHYLSRTRTPQQRLQRVELNTVVRETLEQLAPQFQHQRVAVDTLLTDIPPLARADGASLQRVLINLLNNAVDALTETRRISVTTRSGSSPENGSAGLFLEVQDTGVGIPPEHLPNVFQLFFTAKNAQQGTGLGLAICQEIVKAHGGTIAISSQLGKGSLVRVFLPCA